MKTIFVYNSTRTRDTQLLKLAKEMNPDIDHFLDIANGWGLELGPYIDELPAGILATMIDPRLVKTYRLENNRRVLSFLQHRPNIIKTPTILINDLTIPVNNSQDLYVTIEPTETIEA